MRLRIRHNWNESPYRPRQWQADAFAAVSGAYDVPTTPPRGVVRAIMGAGKSVLIAEICAAVEVPVVVTTPTIALVDQLYKTIAYRCGAGNVGRYYTHRKEVGRRVTICCHPSFGPWCGLTSEESPARWWYEDSDCNGLWIADECHKTESESMIEAVERLRPMWRLGVTATPYRAAKSEELSQFDRLLFDYGAAKALADGVVVPWEIRNWDGEQKPIDDVCAQMLAEAPKPAIVNAVSIEDAEAFAALLREGPHTALTVHSKRTDHDNRSALGGLRSGAVSIVVAVNMLSEGFDFPQLRTLCLRRPSVSRLRFVQEVGRALRSAPGKSHAVILDPWDHFGEHRLNVEAVLEGMAPKVERDPVQGALADLFDVLPAELATKTSADTIRDLLVSALAEDDSPIFDAVATYVRKVAQAFILAEAYSPNVASRSWRYKVATQKQQDTARNLEWTIKPSVCAKVPKRHRQCLGVAIACADRLSRGHASDLISILFACKNTQQWPLSEALEALAS